MKKESEDENEVQLLLNEEEQKALLKRHLTAPPTNFNNLIIRADLHFKELLRVHKKAGREQDRKMDLLDNNNLNSGPGSFDCPSKLADKLAEDAERRESHFNNERLLAAQTRLTINQHRVKPLKLDEFTKKITPLLKQTENNFGRRHHHFG